MSQDAIGWAQVLESARAKDPRPVSLAELLLWGGVPDLPKPPDSSGQPPDSVRSPDTTA